MAFTPNSYLSNNTNVILRDPQHASRLFVNGQFRLAPKHKFLFHVAFNINQGALKDINLIQRHRNEINMLVKSADLPNFQMTVETLNQYNRKKNVQSKHDYQPINITFHDDNMGIINQLWQNYYSYYYADSTSATSAGAYRRNATKNSNYINTTFGLDNGSQDPFFYYITIYQMARHEYVSYTLLNPIITSWNHNKVDYSQGQGHDNTMQIKYEAVAYGQGEVVFGDPDGFGFEHYDTTPSPLQGDVPTPGPSFSNQTDNRLEFANVVAEQLNTYQNTQDNLPNPTSSILQNLIPDAQQGVSGLQGFRFPTTSSTSSSAVASENKNLPAIPNSADIAKSSLTKILESNTQFQTYYNSLSNAEKTALAARASSAVSSAVGSSYYEQAISVARLTGKNTSIDVQQIIAEIIYAEALSSASTIPKISPTTINYGKLSNDSLVRSQQIRFLEILLSSIPESVYQQDYVSERISPIEQEAERELSIAAGKISASPVRVAQAQKNIVKLLTDYNSLPAQERQYYKNIVVNRELMSIVAELVPDREVAQNLLAAPDSTLTALLSSLLVPLVSTQQQLMDTLNVLVQDGQITPNEQATFLTTLNALDTFNKELNRI